ncbi:MAG: phosphoenolpyruvate carboxykinase (ATP) [Bacteroidota bacterium]
MKAIGIKHLATSLQTLGITPKQNILWNLAPEALTQEALSRGQAELTDQGVLSIQTGEFTGRSPKDRFIVKDAQTAYTVDWGEINQPFEEGAADRLYQKVAHYLEDRDLFVQDVYACADQDYRLNIRLIAEKAWSCQFATNMFRTLAEEEYASFQPEWNILCAPGFMADPEVDGTRQHNFAIINFSKKYIIIGGTGYTGEIKKGIFSVLNHQLPLNSQVLPMHCSSNVGEEGDVAVFFGLSGTGKTTLSADPYRKLIGDDEHGWSSKGVFNFEGGCYAKCIGLTDEEQPSIYRAIRPGAILENIGYQPDSKTPDYNNQEITENTRVSYPINHISNLYPNQAAGHPNRIFFLTCDAFGVLPPVSKLTPEQAMYYFLSGYTAKVAGTEAGITEPRATFSTCFGAPFLPLSPVYYSEMLGEKIQEHQAEVWLINTGWIGGGYGVGKRISLTYTKAILSAIFSGRLDNVSFETDSVFGLHIPTSCPLVPTEVLNPRQSWADPIAYDRQALMLADKFSENIRQFVADIQAAVLEAGPKVVVV